MRTICAPVVAVALLFAAVPAQAADGHVPAALLKSLGLAELKVLSDQEAHQIRGQGGVVARSTSVINGLVLDPNTKSFVFGSDANGAVSSAENAGKAVTEASTSTTSSINLNLTVTSNNGTFVGGVLGGAGGNAAASIGR